MSGKWVLLSVSAILIAAAAGALSRYRNETVKPAAPAARTPAPAPQGELNLPGKIQARRVLPVGDQAGGDVESFQADVGQEVFENQVLARMSNPGLETAREMAAAAARDAQERVNKLEAEILSARLEASRSRADAMRSRSEYDQADRFYRRQKTLHDAGATPRLTYEKSERDFETARAQYDSLDALARQAESRVTSLLEQLQNTKKILDDKSRELDAAQASLDAMEVRSPVTGLITARRGEVGKSHEPGVPLFDIAVDLAELQVTVQPEPEVLARMKPGQPALVALADLQSQGFSGAVAEVHPTEAVIAFTSDNPAVKPGMTAQVRIRLNEK